MESVRVGLIGWGTVGCGVIRVLEENASAIQARLGFPLELVRVADLDLDSPRPVSVGREKLTTNVRDILEDPHIQIVVELIGGLEPARTFILQALDQGKHVVTANKALLAHHGNELFAHAARRGCCIGFEASVAGGIPLLKSIREGLAANRVDTIFGILNGTGNYILTRMTEEGLGFEEALREAQERGYAEADPTLDVDGIDTAHKLAIAGAMAFGTPIQFDQVYVEGIRHTDPLDVQFASEFGYQLKLLAIGRHVNGQLEMRVHPTLIPSSHVLASVRGAYNAVHLHGNAVGNIMLYGLGAGMMPTGSAVVADMVDIARDLTSGGINRVPPLSFLPERTQDTPVRPMEEVVTRYYFRFSAVDRPGVLSKISGILGENAISIAAVIQKGRQVGGAVPIVMLTHEAQEEAVRRSLQAIDRLDIVRGPTRIIRIEDTPNNDVEPE
ncbi:homoserine dehydrogenase [Desulfacinum hydrothermale DSM 13146]|uniref:Homoserine dehydrogenase n=1 Tax=Desulfacinum hydrothermale DSM 13146 TaxID=1121390 RepID=A0A1W1XJ70_9BACT|nr:homoserine dehydrogenase [Desulfacinum hydrothermale]SMC24009.1 homoserine dehydrogenase [Desulfacinum hydrothermale DSM 13146]